MAAVGETNAGPKATIKRICNISSHVAAAESVAPPVNSTMPKERVYQLRKKHFCAAQSISYENTNPLLIVRGNGQYLFDEAGNQYLDTRNNVGHVGHSNKRVANAVAAQALALNTNTRYLHQNISLLAEKLAATLPDPLEICFFVNSGSEANDLAIRLARAHTGHENFVVVDRAYHGHTSAVIDISPYKYEHKGGEGRKPWIQQVICPDAYRGVHRGAEGTGPKYAEYVAEACATAGGKVAGFFVESGMSVAGVILPPAGYLENAYAHVRAAGGVTIADEVQVGFGRFGTSFWGFEQQGVVPDIVTMGKPFGNGMPLAAVVTSAKIADSFHNGLEYFNTFGGNPVCAAAGLAVLETIEEDQLQKHALEVGAQLIAGLQNLAKKHPIIGDVRGSGLFLGIEFVEDLVTLKPAAAETSFVVSELKDAHRILTSIDGPFDNVIVMKPPMCFSSENAIQFLAALDDVLMRMPTSAELAKIGHTPT